LKNPPRVTSLMDTGTERNHFVTNVTL
jgi:hypothetical protein